jgi:hypothetical protein
MTVSKEILKYKLHLSRIHGVRWYMAGRKPAGEFTLFYGKRDDNHE